jgi:plasmid stabilization system protein ParE
MADIIRSPRAKKDIREVLAITKDKFGKLQARKYSELIEAALEAIAEKPERGKVRIETRPGIVSYHIKQPGRDARHIFFYRIAADGTVEIVRLLPRRHGFRAASSGIGEMCAATPQAAPERGERAGSASGARDRAGSRARRASRETTRAMRQGAIRVRELDLVLERAPP